MKKQAMALALMLMMLFTIGVAFAEETAQIVGQPGDFDTYVGSEDGKLLHTDVYKPSLIERIFEGQAFNFVDVETDELNDYQCSLSNTAGSYNHAPGHDGLTGGLCGVGKFIVFKSDGGEIPAGTILFDNLWHRSEQLDLPNFKNYYLDDKQFTYSYACYTCDISDTTSSEPGCLTDDADACVPQDHPSCDIWYGYESACMQHIEDDSSGGSGSSGGSSGKAIDINNAESSKSTYEVGDIVEIVGYADINEDVNNAVIETSLEYVEYVDFQPFAITSQLDKGVCGDDITTGIKFDADDGDEVAFKLKMTAKTPGTYEIRVVAATGCGEGITDSYYVDEFTIVAGSEPPIDDDSQDGTVEDDTASEDLSDQETLIDWSDFVDSSGEGAGDNIIAKVTNTPTKELVEKAFDYKNEPETAYTITFIIIGLLVLIGIIIYQVVNRK